MNNITYREATIKDLDRLIELGYLLSINEKKSEPLLKVNNETKKESREHYKKELKLKTSKFYVAQNGEGKIIGYQYGYIKDTPDHIVKYKRMGHLEAAYIEEECRGKQVGKVLTQMLMDWFKKNKVSLVELGVYSKNVNSVEVWRKLGFEDYHISMRKFI